MLLRLGLPRPHELDRGAARRTASASRPPRARDELVGAPQRRSALGLDGVDPRQRVEPRRARARRRAPRSRRSRARRRRPGRSAGRASMPSSAEVGDELVAERRAALDREPVQVALAGERQRAARRARRAARGRSGRRPLRASRGQTTICAPSSLEPRASRPGRRPAARRRSSARPAAAARTAAASAALPQLAIASRGRSSGFDPRRARSATSSWSSTSKRWRALCEPETFPVSSLTQTPPAAREAERASSARRCARTASTAKPVPVDRRDARVEAARRARRSRRRRALPRAPRGRGGAAAR